MAYSVQSQDIRPKGLKVGEAAPDFEGINQFGQKVSLSEKLKEGKAVVLFYRGSWCSYCKRQLSDLQESLSDIMAKGAEVIAITPERQEGIKKLRSKLDLGFNILHDNNMEIMRAYDVNYELPEKQKEKFLKWDIDLKTINAENGENLPVPAVYIVGQDGKIEFRFFDENFRKWVDMDDLIEKI
ncbi:peroxiredoxin-like family protein [Aureibacter tunicatorum]|uniref:thioredoxin-dependent peroxiredoxin n=1 Tax=Aureibacter tunicatorum TaxID=866807 RepID=A0AAE4BR48_9BACT|nr:peroxiredoxin-like family protein [Aureibacter tunicatorum]MDR6237385.1 peroxiredoxin [Aureibacter tunicatorum]BDD06375.1 peroxiredoxin [Aureibacter tunicatorum]